MGRRSKAKRPEWPPHESEEERRDYYDSLIDGPNWQTPDAEKPTASSRADINDRSNVLLEVGVEYGITVDLEMIAQDVPWWRREFARIAGNHDDLPEQGNTPQELSATESESEQRAANWIGEPAVPKVPHIGEAIIGLICGSTMREAILGDLAERFEERACREGARSAQAWYWRHVAKSIGAFAWRFARRLIELDEILQRIGL